MHKKLQRIKSVLTKPWLWFKSQSIKKKIIVIVVLLISVIVVANIISTLTKSPPYTLERVSKDNIVETVTESGNITTSGKIDVYSPTNGFITETYVKNGAYVKEGEKLFVVKSSASEQEKKQAQANYLAAVNSLNTVQAAANTLRASMYAEWKSFTDIATNSTYESGGKPDNENRKAAEFQIAQDQWLAAEKEYKDQQTAISQAQASVASTYALYMATQDATVIAPADGIVTNLSVTKGSTVGIKSVLLTGETSKPALILLSNYQSEISIELSETDVAKVNPGQKVKINVSAVSNKEYDGVVNRVDSVGTNVQGVITYNAYISLQDPDNNLRQGMSVDVTITTKEVNDVLSVSNSAIKPYQGGKAVRVPDNTKPEKFKYVPVIAGVRGEEKTQISNGLVEGQEVIKTLSNEGIKRSGLFGG